mgnify:CR=1 FL=1
MSRETKYAAGAAGIVALLGLAAYAVANNKISWGTSKVCAPWLRNGPVALVGDSIGVGMEKPLRLAVSPAPLTAIPKGGHAANQTLQRVKDNPKILESDLIFVSLGSNDYAGQPNAKAIQAAHGHIVAMAEAGLVPNDVDADVLGGVALTWDTPPLRDGWSMWVACMNTGEVTLVISDAERVRSHGMVDMGRKREAA